MLLCASRHEKMFPRGPKRECTLPECMVRGGLSDSLPDVAGMSHVLLPLSCFKTPPLVRVASRYARGVGSPKWFDAQGRSSNWQPAGEGGARHLDWKSLENGCLHMLWKYSALQVPNLSPEGAFLQKSGV